MHTAIVHSFSPSTVEITESGVFSNGANGTALSGGLTGVGLGPVAVGGASDGN